VLLVGDPSAAFTVVFGLLLKRDGDKEIGLFVVLLRLLKTAKLVLVVLLRKEEEEEEEEERTTRVTDDDDDARLPPPKVVEKTVVMMVVSPFVCAEKRKERGRSLAFFFDGCSFSKSIFNNSDVRPFFSLLHKKKTNRQNHHHGEKR